MQTRIHKLSDKSKDTLTSTSRTKSFSSQKHPFHNHKSKKDNLNPLMNHDSIDSLNESKIIQAKPIIANSRDKYEQQAELFSQELMSGPIKPMTVDCFSRGKDSITQTQLDEEKDKEFTQARQMTQQNSTSKESDSPKQENILEMDLNARAERILNERDPERAAWKEKIHREIMALPEDRFQRKCFGCEEDEQIIQKQVKKQVNEAEKSIQTKLQTEQNMTSKETNNQKQENILEMDLNARAERILNERDPERAAWKEKIHREIMALPEDRFQRKCYGCEEDKQIIQKQVQEEEEELLQAKGVRKQQANPSPALNSADSSNVNAIDNIKDQLGSGLPLENTVKNKMENAFGTDFSSVSIHTNPNAVKLAADFKARAFTIGQQIAFNSGEYRPNTFQGDLLIAHELVHTLQQKGAKSLKPISKNANANQELEKEADYSAFAAVASYWDKAKKWTKNKIKIIKPRLKSSLSFQRCAEASPCPAGYYWKITYVTYTGPGGCWATWQCRPIPKSKKEIKSSTPRVIPMMPGSIRTYGYQHNIGWGMATPICGFHNLTDEAGTIHGRPDKEWYVPDAEMLSGGGKGRGKKRVLSEKERAKIGADFIRKRKQRAKKAKTKPKKTKPGKRKFNKGDKLGGKLKGCKISSIICFSTPPLVNEYRYRGGNNQPAYANIGGGVPWPRNARFIIRGLTDFQYKGANLKISFGSKEVTLKSLRKEDIKDAYQKMLRLFKDSQLDRLFRNNNTVFYNQYMAHNRGVEQKQRKIPPGWTPHHIHPLDWGGSNNLLNLWPLRTNAHTLYTNWWNSLKRAVAREMGLTVQSSEWRALMRGDEHGVIR